MGLNLAEAFAVGTLLRHLTGTSPIEGHPVPTREQAREAAAVLAGAAYSRLSAGLSRTGAKQLLDEKWPDPDPEPLLTSVEERVVYAAGKVGQAAAEEAVHTLTIAEVCTWMADLGLTRGDDTDWTVAKQITQAAPGADVAVVFPALVVREHESGGE